MSETIEIIQEHGEYRLKVNGIGRAALYGKVLVVRTEGGTEYYFDHDGLCMTKESR